MAWNRSSPPPLTYCRLGHAEVTGQGLLGPRLPDRFLDQFSLGQERPLRLSDNRYNTLDTVSVFRYSPGRDPRSTLPVSTVEDNSKAGAEGVTNEPQALAPDRTGTVPQMGDSGRRVRGHMAGDARRPLRPSRY